MCDRSNRDTQQCFAAVLTAVLCCCSAVLLLWTPAAAAKQQPYCAQGTRYHVLVQKIVRTSTIIYITYYNQVSHARTLRKSNAAPGITSRGFKPVFLFGCIHIYIYFIYIPVYIHFWSWVLFFFCAEEDFFTLSDTTKTYQIQHIIHIIPFV